MVDGRLPLLKCHFHNGSLGLVQASWRDVIASLTGAESANINGSGLTVQRAAATAMENAGKKIAPMIVQQVLKLLDRPAYVEIEVGGANFRFARTLKERLGAMREVEIDGRVNFSSGVATARIKTKLNAFDVASVLDCGSSLANCR